MKRKHYQQLIRSFAAGLACTVILIGSHIPTPPGLGNIDNGPGIETQDDKSSHPVKDD